PREVVALDAPDMAECDPEDSPGPCHTIDESEGLFAGCIEARRDFHIDPYGTLSFCSFIKDPALRYDLRKGSFTEGWEVFIPGLAGKVNAGPGYRKNCGACDKRADCRWCPVYAYLESGNYSAKIPYLCAVADEERTFRDEWKRKHRRYFRVAGITICIESDTELGSVRFNPALLAFAVPGPGKDNVVFRHHFEMPDTTKEDFGPEVYRKAPWVISRKEGSWVYREIGPNAKTPETDRLWIFSEDYSRGSIYLTDEDKKTLRTEGWHSLTHLTTDQIWLAPLLADRGAVMMHSSAISINGQGLLFAGHSGAGKSTTVTMIKNAGTGGTKILRSRQKERSMDIRILCDDRNIVQHTNGRWTVQGTWNHGDVPEVSADPAPLRGILFLQQDTRNRLVPITDKKEVWKRLLAVLVRPMGTATWWQKELDVLEKIVNNVPCYLMQFDTSGRIVSELGELIAGEFPADKGRS
ncbi:MAG: hypothetical protein GYA23_09400, partial [Methanomicrobiales archaeon]|nr:hypothetical protein [Methanomicrobiales archaeon]